MFAAAPRDSRAQETQSSARPRLGLVLAGGGAKGGAHVGVLKVLEEMRVPIDCIAGTSMGALVGGGYASGIPAAELEKFVTTINWGKVVGSQGRRDLEPIEQKRAGATYSNEFEFGLTPDGLTIPGGLVNTSNIEDLLRSYVATARLQDQFDKLPIPFRAVATDMVTGRMVVLEGWRPGHGHARQHGHSRRVCAGHHRQLDPQRTADWCGTFRSTWRASCVPTGSSS